MAKDYFDSVALMYTQKSEGKIWRLRRQSEAAAIANSIGSGFLGDVLELGCGSGYYTRRLSDQGCKSLVAVDFSPKMMAANQVPGCIKKTADIQEFLSEDKFDLILCAGVFEFLKRPEIIFSNASKMLRAKGSLVVLLPQLSLFGRLYQLYHRFHHVQVRLFNLKEVEEWARMVELTLTRSQKVSFCSLVLRFSKLAASQ